MSGEVQYIISVFEEHAAKQMWTDMLQKQPKVYIPNGYRVPSDKKRKNLRWQIRNDMAQGVVPPSAFDWSNFMFGGPFLFQSAWCVHMHVQELLNVLSMYMCVVLIP